MFRRLRDFRVCIGFNTLSMLFVIKVKARKLRTRILKEVSRQFKGNLLENYLLSTNFRSL